MKKNGGFGITGTFLLVLVIAIVAIAGWQVWSHDRDSKADAKTNLNAQQVAAALNKKVSDNAYIPTKLQAAGIQPNSNITFTKLDYASYQFCVFYKTSNGSPTNTATDQKLTVSTVHTKGQNCQSVHPFIDPIQISGSEYVCDVLIYKDYTDNTDNSGYIDNIINDSQKNTVIRLNGVARGTAGPFTIRSTDKVFNGICHSIPTTSLKAGDPLYIFTTTTGQHVVLQEKLTWH